MSFNKVTIGTKSFAPEWFDFDRSEKMVDEVEFFMSTPIQKKFEEIEDILRDEAHEGIGEAVQELRNMVTRLQKSHLNLQNMMNATLSALKDDK